MNLVVDLISAPNHDKLPKDKREAHKLRVNAAWFWIFPSRNMYKRSYLGPYLLCIYPSLIEDVLF